MRFLVVVFLFLGSFTPVSATTPNLILESPCYGQILKEGKYIPRIATLLNTVTGWRYPREIVGLQEIVDKGTSGVIFYGTHPTEIAQPLLDYLILRDYFHPRAWIREDQVGGIISKWLITNTNMMLVPLVKTPTNLIKKEGALLPTSADYLNAGGNLLIYPGARVKRGQYENVEFNPAKYLLKKAPKARMVLFRHRGWWGSRFSVAPTGTFIDMKRVLFCAGVWCATGFGRKHPIQIEFKEFENFPTDEAEAKALIEDFFNPDPLEPNTYHPYSVFEKAGPRILPEPTYYFPE